MNSLRMPKATVNHMLWSLGLPNTFSDRIGDLVKAKYARRPEAAQKLLAKYRTLFTPQSERALRVALPPTATAPKPAAALKARHALVRQTFYQWKSLRHTATAAEIRKYLTNFIPHKNATARAIAKDPAAIERLLRANPRFKAYMEKKLGGKILWDPEATGMVLVRQEAWFSRPDWEQRIHWLVKRFLNRSQKNLPRAVKKAGKHVSGPPGSTAPAQFRDGGDIGSLLNDPRLSLEDRLILLLAKFAEKKLKELENKVRELEGVKSSGGASNTHKTRKGVPVGGLSGWPGGAVSKSGSGGKSETMIQAQIQILQQKLQRAMELLSNMMKSFHDAMSTSIRNIR